MPVEEPTMTKVRFRAELVQGHKGVTAVIVPFDPEERWHLKPVKLDPRRDGWLVKGTINGTPFDGYVGFRWKRFFILVEPELRQVARIAVGDEVAVVVEPTESTKTLAKARVQSKVTTAPAKGRADARTPSAAKKSFTAKLDRVGPGGGWTRMQIPFDVEKAFGSKARVAVSGTMNGFAFRTSILPNGDGTHHMMLNKALLAGAKVDPGATVKVVMERDDASREVPAPKDLLAALAKNAAAKRTWGEKTPTCRKEYVAWIEEAKAPETRARRIVATVERVAAGKRRYD
jgi:hypothetical protein